MGKIVKTHGLKGRVKVFSYLESPGLLESVDEIYIQPQKSQERSFGLKRAQIKGNCFYLELEGVDSIDKAEALIGLSVLVPAEKMGRLAEGEYYWQQLMGLDVVTEEGRFIGTIAEIFPTGSNDVFVCRGGEKEILLPAIEDVVRKIDLGKGMVTVRLLEGL